MTTTTNTITNDEIDSIEFGYNLTQFSEELRAIAREYLRATQCTDFDAFTAAQEKFYTDLEQVCDSEELYALERELGM